MGMATLTGERCAQCRELLRFDAPHVCGDRGRATARARAYRDAAAMVRNWSRGYSTRIQSDMDMLAKQIEARSEDHGPA